MSNRTILFITLAIQMISANTNTQCIMKKLQEHHSTLIPMSKQSDNGNSRLLAQKNLDFGMVSGNSQKKLKITTTNHLNVNRYNYVEEIYQDSFLNELDEVDFFVNKVCVPYMVDTNIHRVPAMVFCYKLVRYNGVEVQFALKNAKLGQKLFGLILQKTMTPFVQEYKNVVTTDNFSYASDEGKQEILDNLKLEMITQYDKDYEQIQSRFLALYEEHVKVGLFGLVNQVDSLTDVIKEKTELGVEELNEKKLNLLLPLITYSDNQSELISKVVEFIKVHSAFLANNNKGHAMMRVSDDILSFIDQFHLNPSNWLHLKVGPVCYKLLIENDIEKPVTTCQALLNTMLKFEDEELKRQFMILSQSTEFGKVIVTKIKAELDNFDPDSGDEISDLETNLVNEMTTVIMDKVEKVKSISDQLSIELTDNKQLLLADLQDLFVKMPEETQRYIQSYDSLTKFEELVEDKVYYNETIRTHVADLREKILKFSESGTKVKINDFIQKLKDKCDSVFNTEKAKLCKKIISNIDYIRFLKFRKSDFFYDLIINDLRTKIDKFDLERTETDLVEQQLLKDSQDFVVGLIHTLNLETERLRKVMDIKDKKIEMIISTAKYVNQRLDKNWEEDILPAVEDWYVQNQSELKDNKLKSEDFELQMNNLITTLLVKFHPNDLKKEMSFIEESISKFSDEIYQEIENNLSSIMLNFDYFDDEVKSLLYPCKLDRNDLPDVFAACEEKAQELNRKCVHHNSFVLKLDCSHNYTENGGDECVANCPIGFSVFNDKHCKKPNVYVLEEDQNCNAHYKKYDNLCVPVCPVGWKDSGIWCERPSQVIEYFWLIQ